MILITISLITFSSYQSVILQEKMTASARENLALFEAVELALLDGESAAALGDYTVDGTDGFYDSVCDTSVAGCYLNTLSDVFNETAWQYAIEADRSVSYGNGSITGEYMIVNMGDVTVGLTSASNVKVVTNQYQDLDSGALNPPKLYKVFARAKTDSGMQKVLVTNFAAATTTTNSPQ
jgi:Tfp pilus assembly protein PilX